MLFKNITILDENFEVKENQFVAVKGDRISYIGPERPEGFFKQEFEGKGRLLMPAFYNAHAHTPMTLLRGYGGGLALNDWLTKKIFPFEAHLTANDVFFSMQQGIAEMLKFGIVSTTDMYMQGESILIAALDAGVKTNLGVGLVCFDPTKKLEDLSDYHNSKYLYENYHGRGDGRVLMDMSVHAEYTSFPGVVKEFADYSRSIGTNMHVHLSETQKEHEECKQRHGKTPAQYFNDLGMFDCPTTAAHCVWLEEGDFDIMAEKGVTVATCPVSNLKLASGICDVKKLYEKGINVALATDGVSSNNNLNMIEEMKFFTLLQKVKHMDPTVITPKQAVEAATKGGAKAQGRKDCGVLKVGNKADLIVLDIDQPHMLPVHSLLDNVVYSADGSDVEMTVCDGKLLYKNGEYYSLDIEKVIYETEKSRKRILSQL
ncbi:MAG: amidohydrolase [Clostridiales bacterium]|nr:amidohydrolase [Clostridiales bacterium]